MNEAIFAPFALWWACFSNWIQKTNKRNSRESSPGWLLCFCLHYPTNRQQDTIVRRVPGSCSTYVKGHFIRANVSRASNTKTNDYDDCHIGGVDRMRLRVDERDLSNAMADAMIPDHAYYADRAAKLVVIEKSIEPAIASITKSVWLKASLLSMRLEDVKKIADEIRGCTPKESLELIVAGLADDRFHE